MCLYRTRLYLNQDTQRDTGEMISILSSRQPSNVLTWDWKQENIWKKCLAAVHLKTLQPLSQTSGGVIHAALRTVHLESSCAAYSSRRIVHPYSCRRIVPCSSRMANSFFSEFNSSQLRTERVPNTTYDVQRNNDNCLDLCSAVIVVKMYALWIVKKSSVSQACTEYNVDISARLRLPLSKPSRHFRW